MSGIDSVAPRIVLSRRRLLAATACLGACGTGGMARKQAPPPKPKLAMEVAVGPGDFLERALARAREGGFDTVLLARADLQTQRQRLASVRAGETRAALSQSGCRPLGIHAALDDLPIGSLSGDDGRATAGAMTAVREALELCASIGGRYLLLGAGAARAVPDHKGLAEARARLTKRLLVAANWAKDRGLTLLVDPLPATETNMITTAAEALGVARAVAHPGLAVALDGHDLLADEANRDLLAESIELVQMVRVGGHGAHLERLVVLLQRAGYGGWLSVAPDARPGTRVAQAR